MNKARRDKTLAAKYQLVMVIEFLEDTLECIPKDNIFSEESYYLGLLEKINYSQSMVEMILGEEEESYENFPDSLKNSIKGIVMEEKIDLLSDALDQYQLLGKSKLKISQAIRLLTEITDLLEEVVE